MKKAQSNDAEAIVFVKAILPENLHQFAHLIPQAVNNHVSWLDPERKKYALTVGLAAFAKEPQTVSLESTRNSAFEERC
jgi:hypothetical protein